MNHENCLDVRASFSAYLDGAVTGHEMQAIAGHLDDCRECHEEFEGWRAMQQTLGSLRTVRAPEDLALKLRLTISREAAARRSNWRDTLSLAWANTLRPLALQASAGLACAIFLIGTIVTLLGFVPPPNAVLANDEPLGAITAPHYLYSASHPLAVVTGGSAVVVEALVNSDGRVYDYTVVSAPAGLDDTVIRAQVQDHMLLAVFKPASVFGVPVKGRIVMTFSGVSVHA